MLETITWTGDAVRLLDQTRLPDVAYVEIGDERQMWDAIKRLVVRGAPAIGVAAAFGVYLGVRGFDGYDMADLDARVEEVTSYLATSRPTAVNLFWALDRMKRVSRETRKQGSRSDELMVVKIKQRLLAEALAMLDEDARVCRAIGEHGLAVLREARMQWQRRASEPGGSLNVLTHCNAGSLATVRYGTALAPIYVGAEQGERFHVFADETRPLLQGSRITASELTSAGIPCTVICDNMAATVLRDKAIDAVIVGADRIAANGDTGNKIGTLGVAILARHFGVPFYVAAPTSTIDLECASGTDIPIEERDPGEVTQVAGRRTAPEGAGAFNPAFDVTPADLITAIITEHGVIRPPLGEGIRDLMARR